jgi:CRISPR/Cas system CMR-associated protein Cmr5 small subunit
MTARELEWFDLETRMRDLIQSQLLPVVRKFSEDREQLVLAKTLCTRLDTRLSKVESLVFGDQDQETVIQQIFTKYAETEGNRKKDAVKLSQEINFIDEKLKSATFNIDKMTEDLKGLNRQLIDLDSEMVKLKVVVEHNKDSVMKELDNIGRNFRELNATYTKVTLKAEEKAIAAFDKSKAIALEIGNYKRELDSIWKSQNEILLMAKHAIATKLDIDDFQTHVESIENQFKGIKEQSTLAKSELFHRDIFIEKYLPLQMASMVSDFLHHCLGLEQLTTLAEFESYIYPAMNKETLNYTVLAREELVQHILDKVKLAEDRKSKLLKVSTKEPKKKITFEVEKVDNIGISYMPLAEPPKDMLTRMMTDKIEDNIIEKLAVKIDSEIKRVKKEVQTKFESFSQKLRSICDQNAVFIKQVASELTDLIDVRKRDKNDAQNEILKQKLLLDDHITTLKKQEEILDKLSKIVICIVETVQIQQTLDAQDEDDRHGVALKLDRDLQNELIANSNPEMYTSALTSSAFTVKKNCLSCGTATSILTGLRTSVVYKPTALFYRAKMYQRPELIAVKGRLIKSCWDAYALDGKAEEVEPLLEKVVEGGKNVGKSENESEKGIKKVSLSFYRNKSGQKGSFRLRSSRNSSDWNTTMSRANV